MSFQLGPADGYGSSGGTQGRLSGHRGHTPRSPSAGLELEAGLTGQGSCAPRGPRPGDVLGTGPAGEPATGSPHHHPEKLSERDQSRRQPRSRDLTFPLCDFGRATWLL